MSESEQLRLALWTLARQAQEYSSAAEMLHGLRDRAAGALRKLGWNDVEIYGTSGDDLYKLVILKADEAFFGPGVSPAPPPPIEPPEAAR